MAEAAVEIFVALGKIPYLQRKARVLGPWCNGEGGGWRERDAG